ncbi:SMI1/KNR4 family protein [Nocardia sp. NBC_00881]|uniref:SMI1/KNR4 family protein n=1 Tax=Nocardia sp. NBC_00881 TaxID=2975995 RepID=UPI00386CC52C|nr:SMI1/KNR4 family protein [Nocardia sp. NBC_00881]
MNSQLSWPDLLGLAIKAKLRLHTLSPETCWDTLPEPKNSEEHIQQFEAERREPIPKAHRNFLLHADGWQGFYFTMDLFGLSELRGEGNGRAAAELLRHHADQQRFEHSSITADNIYPVAAGRGEELVVTVRSGAHAGRVIWLDEGIERTSYPNFKEFFAGVLALNQNRIEDLQRRGA